MELLKYVNPFVIHKKKKKIAFKIKKINKIFNKLFITEAAIPNLL